LLKRDDEARHCWIRAAGLTDEPAATALRSSSRSRCGKKCRWTSRPFFISCRGSE